MNQSILRVSYGSRAPKSKSRSGNLSRCESLSWGVRLSRSESLSSSWSCESLSSSWSFIGSKGRSLSLSGCLNMSMSWSKGI